jgi:hypothetical protein
MGFSLTPEEYITLASFCAVVVIVGMFCGWAIASAGPKDIPEEQDDERSERRY